MKGDTAHNDPAPSPDYPVNIGGVAETTAPAAVSDGDRVRAWFDEYGRLVVALQDTSGNDRLTFSSGANGELAGNTAATQMPTVACQLAKIKAHYDNAGRVYFGWSSAVTIVDGTTDTTSGLQLSAGEETGWIPVDNLNRFWRISDNAGDDLTYLCLG